LDLAAAGEPIDSSTTQTATTTSGAVRSANVVVTLTPLRRLLSRPPPADGEVKLTAVLVFADEEPRSTFLTP
jgi:hypothetical protein